jgi:hypothetical protein
LKRRAGREAKADNFDDIEMAEPTQPSILFHVPESLDSGGPSQPPGSLQSRIPDSMMDLDVGYLVDSCDNPLTPSLFSPQLLLRPVPPESSSDVLV